MPRWTELFSWVFMRAIIIIMYTEHHFTFFIIVFTECLMYTLKTWNPAPKRQFHHVLIIGFWSGKKNTICFYEYLKLFEKRHKITISNRFPPLRTVIQMRWFIMNNATLVCAVQQQVSEARRVFPPPTRLHLVHLQCPVYISIL